MIEARTDRKELEYIRKRLQGTAEEVNEVLRKSINDTLLETRKMIKERANEVYVVKLSAMRHTSKVKRANRMNMEGTITYTGKSSRLSDFRISPASANLTGANAPEFRRAKVKKSSRLTPLVIGDTKAFLVKFESGHKAVAERTGVYKEGKGPGHGSREHIKELSSVSVPQMVGNEKDVYNIVEPKMVAHFYKNMDKQIERMLRRK